MWQEVSIKLLNERPFWLPGDQILGEVQLDCYDQVDITTVSITFQGRTETDRLREHDRVLLFSLDLVLFQGPFTILPGLKSWPFGFIVPQNCGGAPEGTREGVKSFRPEPMYDISRDQMLPPTFSHDLDRESSCQVEYTLQAVVHDTKSFSKAKKEAIQVCIAQPRTSEPEQFDRRQSPYPFFIHTMRLDTEVGDRKLTFKEKMRTAFSPDKIPTANFRVLVDLPQAVTADSSVNPILHVQHLGGGTLSSPPEVILMWFSLDIKAEIFHRTRGREQHRSTSTKHLGRWTPIKGIPLMEAGFEAAELFRNGLVVPSNTPTFRTFNIAVRYNWKVEFKVMCAGKQKDGKINMPCVMLGPPAQIPIADEVALSLVPVEEELPPAYTRQEQAIEDEPPRNNMGYLS